MYISAFPASLHATLHGIDEDGNGELGLDELTEVFQNYAVLKKASAEGEVAICTLPKAIQPSMKIFDLDGSGSISNVELSRGAELYAQSKNQVKRLTKFVFVLLAILFLTIGAITGLTVFVVERAKESNVETSGISVVKGTSTPVATAGITEEFDITEAMNMTTDELLDINSYDVEVDGVYLAYTITGFRKDADAVTLYSSRGDTVIITASGAISILDAKGAVVADIPVEQLIGRHLSSSGCIGCNRRQKAAYITNLRRLSKSCKKRGGKLSRKVNYRGGAVSCQEAAI